MIRKLKNLYGSVRVLHENNRYLKEILKAQVFNSTICESTWLHDKSFSPGGWAVDYNVLYTLYRVLNDTSPANILEFGLGQSSRMIYQYATHTGCFAQTIEHDPEWVNFFKAGVKTDLDPRIAICELEKIQYKGYETIVYKDLPAALGTTRFELVLVDAPFGTAHYSRSQVINMVPGNLGTRFCIILDDYNREGEKETFDELCKKLTEYGIAYKTAVYHGLKDHALVCSPDLRFLTSL